MDTQVSMYSGTADTKKNAQIPRGPSRPCSKRSKKNQPPGSKIFQENEQNLKRKTNEDYDMLPLAPQSAQYLFSSSFSNSDKIAWFEFCCCPLSLCALEDIIKGNGRRKRHNLPSVNTKKMANKNALRKPALSPRTCGTVVWSLRNNFDVIVASYK